MFQKMHEMQKMQNNVKYATMQNMQKVRKYGIYKNKY